MNAKRFSGGMVVFLGCASLAGCGNRGYDGDQRFPLTGKITLDGQVVDAGTISFLPKGGGKDQRVSGGEIVDGKYDVVEAQGANSGSYRVEIRWAKKTGKQFKDRELGIMVDERKEGLPARFHSSSELSVDVAAGKTNFDFDLKSN